MAMHPVAVFHDPLCHLHDVGGGHPERPARLGAVEQAARDLAAAGLPIELVTATDAEDEAILRVHTAPYFDALRDNAGRWWSIDPDTTSMPESYAAAVRAAGCAIAAVDHVCAQPKSGKPAARAFVAVRPPGHHAFADRGMGFCLLNNIAIAARHAQATHGAKKVAIVDFDVHHGNGTEAIFYDDPTVLFMSSHQGAFYPGTGHKTDTGRGAGQSTTFNFPLPRGTGDDVLRQLYSTEIPRILADFAPDLLLVSAGYDIHERDPLAGLQATDDGIGDIAAALVKAADNLCGGRVVFVLEGGYDLVGLAGGVTQSLRALLGERTVGQ